MVNNNKKILVIDDEAHIRKVIELKLKNRGYQVVTARNGEEGFDLIHRQEPHAVITDIMMPKMDGKSLSEKTNALKEARPFLTIVLTCRISPDEHKWLSRMKDTILLEKPFSPSRLIEYLEDYFARQAGA